MSAAPDRGPAFLRNPGLAVVIQSALRRGIPRWVLDRRFPGAVDALLAPRRGAPFAPSDPCAAPERTDASVSSDATEHSGSNAAPDTQAGAGVRSFTDDERRRLVAEAPAMGLRAWLSERRIAPPDFYRWRKEFAS